MSNLNELNQCYCDKIDPQCVDAYFDLSLNNEDPSVLVLDHSWGQDEVDLTNAVKDAETITTLSLTPDSLQFNREDYGRDGAPNGGVDCINGDDLSRIISLQYLKDVHQVPPTNGIVYMYSEDDKRFNPFNLQQFVNETNEYITNLQNQVTVLGNRVSTLETKVTNLENKTAKPSYAPADAVIAWGNINNVYNADTSRGIFTHSVNNTVLGDERFS